MTLKTWLRPKTEDERWAVIFFNLDLAIWIVRIATVFAWAAAVLAWIRVFK